jgi:hypothetical protein
MNTLNNKFFMVYMFLIDRSKIRIKFDIRKFILNYFSIANAGANIQNQKQKHKPKPIKN